ncbi:hypothetical protein BKA61DRAFT_704587 [Leptodontidium sp. MPI-SDFR-AT-0119]|nr:hypothetical protein BKA61DRAFT_704587 [Leptodontidium sp. MPI-SDFR-AT-0119]
MSGCILCGSWGANLTDLMQQIPICAIGCISKGVVDMPPSLTDPNSVCRNDTLEVASASRVLTRCIYDDQALVAVVKAKFCEGVPIESRAWDVAIIGLTFGPIALTAVILRCYSRYSKNRKLGSDDWLAVAAGLTVIPVIAIGIYNSMINGYGRHYWDLEPYKIKNLLKMFYVTEVLFITALTLVKASMLLRVFTPRWFVIVDLMTLCCVVLAGLAIMFCLIFQCSPVSGVWDRTLNSRCLNINTICYSSAVISVALDVIILILPIPVLIRLKMSMKKKLSLIMMFSLGSLACVTSGIRLKYLVAFTTSKDPTWDNALPAIWGFIEKVGPSYNKRAISRAPSHTPTQASTRSSEIFPRDLSYHFSSQFRGLYQSRGRKDSDTYTPHRIWVNSRLGSHGNLVDFQGVPLPDAEHAKLHYSVPTSESSLWVLEGPRTSDDLHKREEERREMEERYVEMRREEERRAEERRVSQALYMAEEELVVKPVGVALPMRKPRNGRFQRGGIQRLWTPIPPEMGTDMF